MKITLQAAAFSAAITLAALLAAPAAAKTTHRSNHTMRSHMAAGHHATTRRSARSKGSMKSGTTALPTRGMASPAMSTAPATSGGDKL